MEISKNTKKFFTNVIIVSLIVSLILTNFYFSYKLFLLYSTRLFSPHNSVCIITIDTDSYSTNYNNIYKNIILNPKIIDKFCESKNYKFGWIVENQVYCASPKQEPKIRVYDKSEFLRYVKGALP